MMNEPLIPNRAGMICTNLVGQVLIMTGFGDSSIWVFPKGHIEKGESPEQAAKREVLEECGIVATPLAQIGITSFKQHGKDVVIQWFSGCAVRKQRVEICEGYAEEDFREIKWVSPEEALDILSFPDLKEVLKKALCYE